MECDLSVIVVTHNGYDLALKSLRTYVDSVSRGSGYGIELIVVDNASRVAVADAVEREFPEVAVIRNEANLGYARACNIGFGASKGRYLLFSNPDIEVDEHTLPSLIRLMDRHPEVGACTPYLQLMNSDRIDPGAHRGFPTPWASFTHYAGLAHICRRSKRLSRIFGRYHLLSRDLTRSHEINVIEGGFFFVRRTAFVHVDRWDDDYFLYGEDIDLCYKLANAGYKVMFFPQARAKHLLGATTGLKAHSQGAVEVAPADRHRAYHAFYDSMRIFYDKHYARKYGAFLRRVILLTIELKRRAGARKQTV